MAFNRVVSYPSTDGSGEALLRERGVTWLINEDIEPATGGMATPADPKQSTETSGYVASRRLPMNRHVRRKRASLERHFKRKPHQVASLVRLIEQVEASR